MNYKGKDVIKNNMISIFSSSTEAALEPTLMTSMILIQKYTAFLVKNGWMREFNVTSA